MNTTSATRALRSRALSLATLTRPLQSRAFNQIVRSKPLEPSWPSVTANNLHQRSQNFHIQRRQKSSDDAPLPLTDRQDETPPASEARAEQPLYQMTFTCRKCVERSTHKISKQGYHHGTILITCPGCKNRHLISDHLKIFSDRSVTIEDILKEKGQLLKRGTLGSEGDVEFWDDGTQTPHQK